MKTKPSLAFLLMTVAAIVAVWPAPSFAATSELSLAENKAGRQRMLSQRIVKSYAQLGLKVQEESAAEELRVAVDVFDDQLTYLKEVSPGDDVTKGLEKVEAIWRRFKPIALGSVSRDGAQSLMEMDGDLLSAANEVVKLLENHSGTHHAERINMAGRQRMLLERMAKFYMLKTWKFADPGVAAGLEQAKRDFEQALAKLRVDGSNTPAIERRLKTVETEWKTLKSALDDSQPQPLVVATSSNRILEVMDEVTSMYVALPSATAAAGKQF